MISPVPENNRWWGVVRHDGVEYLPCTGGRVPRYLKYRIRTGDTETVTVSASGHAARISGGADMHIRAGRLDNEASFILAGGSMTLSGDILNNHGWQEGPPERKRSGGLPPAHSPKRGLLSHGIRSIARSRRMRQKPVAPLRQVSTVRLSALPVMCLPALPLTPVIPLLCPGQVVQVTR